MIKTKYHCFDAGYKTAPSYGVQAMNGAFRGQMHYAFLISKVRQMVLR
jgi:hypothetical protein